MPRSLAAALFAEKSASFRRLFAAIACAPFAAAEAPAIINDVVAAIL
jgi:hypothetical protein